MKGLKRNEFDIVLPPPPAGGGGGGQKSPDMKGVQQLQGDDGDGDGESGKSQPYTPIIKSPKSDSSKSDSSKSDSSKSDDSKSDDTKDGKDDKGTRVEKRKPGESGDGDGDGGGGSGDGEEKEGEGKDGKGKGKGKDSDIIYASSDIIDISKRGIGGILTSAESEQMQKELGVPFESPPDGKEIKDKVRQLQPLLDRQGSSEAGTGKGDRIRLLPDAIAKLVNTIVDWKDLFKRLIGKVLGSKTEAIMPNRRFVSGGDYVYGSRKSKTKLKTCVIAVDVSGSVGGKELMVMINEVRGIAAQRKFKKFEIVYFDHGIQHVDKLSDTQAIAYKPVAVGGGGTSFIEPLEYMNAIFKKGELDLAIFMTDGFADLNLPTPKFKEKFIWLILDHPSFKAPFGNKVVFIDVEAGKGSV